MSSAVAALTSVPAKSQRKTPGPTVSDLILRAISAPTERGGVSLAALKKALKDGGYDVGKNKARIVTAIKRLVANKSIVQTKGKGASGSFRANKNPPTPPKKKVVRKKKPTAKRARVSKTTDGSTPAAKKSPKKKMKAKSLKKAKKAVGAKKSTSPKKPKRRVVRSTRSRAAAAAKK
ncbi:LOW QUALITY PROTEIN: protamine-like protein [Lampetra planeri]